ncbi:rCG58959 [Rattus norvegicus]|uniref:RCG58959 n=1 Tax=Rattus norvegicus TaxID=10116 RepID=A6KQ57_RAT|nr:rCG58959 [Rattus norvegicus]
MAPWRRGVDSNVVCVWWTGLRSGSMKSLHFHYSPITLWGGYIIWGEAGD